MEVAIAAESLKVAYQLLVFGIKIDQVPDAVRRCIELVRTCHYDLEDLIRLRNQSLPLLESKPAILNRINTIVERARTSLFEVARLVEKLRPEAHEGNTPFISRLERLFVSSRDFKSQEPLISRQHSSVIAELNFLRQLILLAPLVDGLKPGGEVAARTETSRPTVAWENVALLDEMLGGTRQIACPPGGPSTESLASVRSSMSQTSFIRTPSVSTTELPPPPYAQPTPNFTNRSWSSPGTVPEPFVYHASVPDVQKPSIFSTGQTAIVSDREPTSASRGVPFLFGDLQPFLKQDSNTVEGQETRQQGLSGTWEKTKTTFDSTGAAFLFGDGELSPRPLAPNWNTVGGQQNRGDSNISSRIPSSSGSNFYLDGANLQLQRPTSLLSHQMAAKPFSTIPQDLIHWQDGVARPRSSPSIQLPELPTHNALSWNPPEEMPAELPPSARCSVTSKPSYGDDIITTRLTLDTPGFQDPKAVAAYATLREHWKPEYLTGQLGANRRELNTAWGAVRNDGAGGSLGVQSVSSGQAAGPFPNDRNRHPGIAELSAVVFPPDPSELE